MSDDGFFGNMPYLATMPSCVLYLRGQPVGSTMRDWSPSHKTITPHGDAAYSTTLIKFPPSSIHFDGTGDYLTAPTSSDYAFGTDPFTISLWVNFSSASVDCQLLGPGTNAVYLGASLGGWDISWSHNNSRLQFEYQYNSAWVISAAHSSFTPTVGTWYHIAITRDATNLQVFINGVAGYTGVDSTNIRADVNLGVAASNSGATTLNGYEDEIAIWKGVALPIGMLYPQTRRLIIG
jgi:hypothetical protein